MPSLSRIDLMNSAALVSLPGGLLVSILTRPERISTASARALSQSGIGAVSCAMAGELRAESRTARRKQNVAGRRVFIESSLVRISIVSSDQQFEGGRVLVLLIGLVMRGFLFDPVFLFYPGQESIGFDIGLDLRQVQAACPAECLRVNFRAADDKDFVLTPCLSQRNCLIN